MSPEPAPNAEPLAAHLRDLAPGALPPPLFKAFARLTVTPTFVVVPLFQRQGQLRARLTRRAATDRHYPGLLHPPGKVILATDTSFDAVFQRLMTSELPQVDTLSPPVLAAPFLDQITRGREISLVHWLHISDPGDAARTFDPAALPEDVIATDLPRIACAVQSYVAATLVQR
jgi:hypothetical protein